MSTVMCVLLLFIISVHNGLGIYLCVVNLYAGYAKLRIAVLSTSDNLNESE